MTHIVTLPEILRRLQEVERALGITPEAPAPMPAPVLPKWPEWNKLPLPSGISPCRVCGLTSDVAMGYVCPRADCPSRVTCGSEA